MSCELSIQKQLLLIMDSLVSSIVTEICQLDIFQSKLQNGNTESDIKLVSPLKCIVIDILKIVNRCYPLKLQREISVVTIVIAKHTIVNLIVIFTAVKL